MRHGVRRRREAVHQLQVGQGVVGTRCAAAGAEVRQAGAPVGGIPWVDQE